MTTLLMSMFRKTKAVVISLDEKIVGPDKGSALGKILRWRYHVTRVSDLENNVETASPLESIFVTQHPVACE
ncbi:GSCOCG00006896001-RA-CDS [Cotesia congregata]|nr:GSCOCG00006896001-RA-CDS [Cotesia congregata]